MSVWAVWSVLTCPKQYSVVCLLSSYTFTEPEKWLFYILFQSYVWFLYYCSLPLIALTNKRKLFEKERRQDFLTKTNTRCDKPHDVLRNSRFPVIFLSCGCSTIHLTGKSEWWNTDVSDMYQRCSSVLLVYLAQMSLSGMKEEGWLEPVCSLPHTASQLESEDPPRRSPQGPAVPCHQERQTWCLAARSRAPPTV